MRLALIYPPFFHKAFNENLPTVDDEFGLFPYISFGYVATLAKKAGWDVCLFDSAARQTTYDKTLVEVLEYKPDLLAFAAHAPQTFHDMLLWAKRLKQDTGLPTLVGGYMTKSYAEEVMSHTCFDYMCKGDSLNFFGPFLYSFEHNSNFDQVPDLYYRSNGILKFTAQSLPIHFKNFPIIDRSIFQPELYYSHVSQRNYFTIGMSSRGCPYSCIFCNMADTGFEGRTPEQVADEMQECREKYGIREIDWFDPVMFQQRSRAMGIAHELIKRKIDIIWSARVRIDSLALEGTGEQSMIPDEKFIEALALSGCRRLFVGIESGDQDVLDAISKKLRPSGIKEILDCATKHGIRILGFFMIGNPLETYETVEKTIRLAKSLPLDYAQFSITVAKPDTQLDKQELQVVMKMDYWREYIKGNQPERVLPTPWNNLTREESEALAKKAYFQFYFRPLYVWKIIKRIESFEELARYVRVALQLFIRPVRSPAHTLSIWQKLKRMIAIFAEAILALSNKKGNRHPVNTFGRNIGGAIKLSRKELGLDKKG